jgi:hypothetical protein
MEVPFHPNYTGSQPFVYHIRHSEKSLALEFYDTISPNQPWSSIQPDVVILAFDISNRATLASLKKVGGKFRLFMVI